MENEWYTFDLNINRAHLWLSIYQGLSVLELTVVRWKEIPKCTKQDKYQTDSVLQMYEYLVGSKEVGIKHEYFYLQIDK